MVVFKKGLKKAKILSDSGLSSGRLFIVCVCVVFFLKPTVRFGWSFKRGYWYSKGM